MAMDLDKICRICGTNSTKLISIWSEREFGASASSSNLQQSELILPETMRHMLCIFGVCANNRFPKNICAGCVDELEAVLSFKQKCNQSGIRWLKMSLKDALNRKSFAKTLPITNYVGTQSESSSSLVCRDQQQKPYEQQRQLHTITASADTEIEQHPLETISCVEDIKTEEERIQLEIIEIVDQQIVPQVEIVISDDDDDDDVEYENYNQRLTELLPPTNDIENEFQIKQQILSFPADATKVPNLKFKCSVCLLEFNQWQSFEQHLKSHESEEYDQIEQQPVERINCDENNQSDEEINQMETNKNNQQLVPQVELMIPDDDGIDHSNNNLRLAALPSLPNVRKNKMRNKHQISLSLDEATPIEMQMNLFECGLFSAALHQPFEQNVNLNEMDQTDTGQQPVELNNCAEETGDRINENATIVQPTTDQDTIFEEEDNEGHVNNHDFSEIILTVNSLQQQMSSTPAQSTQIQKLPFKCDLCLQEFVQFELYQQHGKSHETIANKLFNLSENSKNVTTANGKFQNGNNAVAYPKPSTSYTSKTNGKRTFEAAFDVSIASQPIAPNAKNKNKGTIKSKMVSTSNGRKYVVEKRFKCDASGCLQSFLSKQGNDKHTKVHTDARSMCDICGKSFSSKVNRDVHAIQCTQTDKYKCNGRTPERRFECVFCHKPMKTRMTLKNHLKIHTQHKQFKCCQCPMSFFHKYRLDTHMNVHTGNRPFVCDICGKSYISKRSRDIHAIQCTQTDKFKCNGRTPERRFECAFCHKPLKTRDNLKKHLKIHTQHTGNRPFVCEWPLCGKVFTQIKNLKKHLKYHKTRRFKCECSASFVHKSELVKHLVGHHKCSELLFCIICSRGFISRNNLTNHTINCGAIESDEDKQKKNSRKGLQQRKKT